MILLHVIHLFSFDLLFYTARFTRHSFSHDLFTQDAFILHVIFFKKM